MSRKNNGNKKSTNNKLSPSDLLRLENKVLADIRKPNARQSSSSGMSKARPANVGKMVQVTNRKPVQTMLANGNVLIKHREFIAKVPGSVNFSSTSVPINPGLPAQFQWLFAIANSYESYKFRKLKYHFVNSKTGTFSGEVIMGIDYDPSDAAPFNEAELQNYWGCKTGVLTEPMTLIADVPALHKIPDKFCRIGALSANQDIKLYDSGNFFIATTDCADTSTIGRLFVEYEVELKSPQVNPGSVLSGTTSAVGSSAASPLGTSLTTVGSLAPVWLSGTTFSIPVPGQYLIDASFVGTVITNSSITAASPSTVTNGPNTGTTTLWSNDVLIKVNSASDIFTIGITATTCTAVVLRIAPFATANG